MSEMPFGDPPATMSNCEPDIGTPDVDVHAQQPNETLWGQVAAIYGQLDAEDCKWIDREWAKMRGYILPTVGTSTLLRSPAEIDADELAVWLERETSVFNCGALADAILQKFDVRPK